MECPLKIGLLYINKKFVLQLENKIGPTKIAALLKSFERI